MAWPFRTLGLPFVTCAAFTARLFAGETAVELLFAVFGRRPRRCRQALLRLGPQAVALPAAPRPPEVFHQSVPAAPEKRRLRRVS